MRYLGRDFERILLWLSLANVIFRFCINYSSVGAFSVATFFLFAFALLFLKESEEKQSRHLRTDAAVIVAFVFLSAMLQKINPEYLAGKEFLPTGTFTYYFRSWTSIVSGPTAFMLAQPLAYISVAIELIIAIGLMVRPTLFAQVAILFLLALSLIHPPVLYVYFLFLPFFILVSEDTSRFVTRYLGSHSVWAPISVAILLKVMVYEIGSGQGYPFFTQALTFTIFGLMHQT